MLIVSILSNCLLLSEEGVGPLLVPQTGSFQKWGQVPFIFSTAMVNLGLPGDPTDKVLAPCWIKLRGNALVSHSYSSWHNHIYSRDQQPPSTQGGMWPPFSMAPCTRKYYVFCALYAYNHFQSISLRQLCMYVATLFHGTLY